MSSINGVEVRDDVYDDQIPEELPEQGGSFIPQLLPGQYWLRIPPNVAQLWSKFQQTKSVDGLALATPIERIMFSFKKDNPLVVVGGEHDGAIMTASISNMPRKRSKKADIPPVSDMTYLIRNGFGDNSPLRTPADYINAVIRQAGQVFPAEVGRQGQCRADAVRWLPDQTGGQAEDPTGTMGCGKRYYTQSFKTPAGLVERIVCTNLRPDGRGGVVQCGASIRGFAQLDKILKKPAA